MAVGARDTALVRTLLQRALVSGSIVYVCITVPTLAASYWVFRLVKQPHLISLETVECLAIAPPAELVWVFITLVISTMIAQHKVRLGSLRILLNSMTYSNNVLGKQ